LKVEPGGNRPVIDLSSIGLRSYSARALYSGPDRPLTKRLASKLGAENMHSMSPLRTSIIDDRAALLAHHLARRGFGCRASMVRRISLPGVGGDVAGRSLGDDTAVGVDLGLLGAGLAAQLDLSKAFSTPCLPIRKPG
jgi:hypothetical protein